MKQRIFLALLSVWLSLPIVAQTAKVKALSPEDAVKSAALHEAAKQAQKAVEEFDKNVKATYASEWVSDIEYSDDWKFIVPKTSATTSGNIWTINGGCPYGGLYYANPSLWNTPAMYSVPWWNYQTTTQTTVPFIGTWSVQ